MIPSIAFGAVKWTEYFGEVGVEPPLPSDIDQILKSPCPFFHGKTVGETHLLTLIPKTVDGKSFTLNSLGKLVQKPNKGYPTKYTHYLDDIKKEHGDSSIKESYWVLLTKDVIPNSRKEFYNIQKQLIADCSTKVKVPYQVPLVLEAATSILMEYVQSGTHLYGESPLTYTRCQERVSKHPNNPLVVGCFAPGGLLIYYFGAGASESDGVGGVRKL